MNQERLERHLDGRGSPEERAAFERDAARDPALAAELDLQRRIDGALGRRFAPPARLVAAPPVRAAGAAGRAPAWPGRAAWTAAAAAAVLVGLSLGSALWRAAQPDGEQVAALSGGGSTEAAAAAQAAGALAPAADPAGGASAVAVGDVPGLPDVASLYERLAGQASVAGGAVGPFDPGALPAGWVDLSCELARRYDACFDVGAPACELLGPYAAPEWPSATVLVGFCEGQGRAPSLLVVDDQTMRGCGLEPDAGGLRSFYKEVNGRAVWEISTQPQPALLDALRSCRD